MVELAHVSCPSCGADTTVLVPEASEPVGTVLEVPSEFPAAADAAVRADCPNDHGFVVFLATE